MASWRKLWENANKMNGEWMVECAKANAEIARLKDLLHASKVARLKAEHDLEIRKLTQSKS